jgi:hypothetical protein
MDILVNILTKLTLVSILVIFTMLIELNILTTSSSSPCSLLSPSRSILVIFIIAIELNILTTLTILVILAMFIAHRIQTILCILIIFIMCIRPHIFNNLSQAQLPIFLNLPVPHSQSGAVPISSLLGVGQLGFWEIGKGGTIG